MWSCLLICTRCSSAQLPILCDTRLGEVNSAGLLVDETLGERLWPTFCHWDVNCAGASVNNVMCLDLRLSVKELEYGCDMIRTTPLGAWTSFRYPEHGLRAVRQNPVPVVPFHTEITSGKVIARGSFGEVAEAEWKGKAVAIKSLMKYNTTAAQMLDEAVIIRNLDHRNIIKLYAISERKKFWVLVMEFAEQGSLNCHGHSTLAKLRIAIEIVEALHHLHSREPPVLHRDLKPGNVLLMGDGTVKLCDFGLSRYREASALYTGLAGTPRYMASDDRVTEKSDIFSFGMLLWALLTEKVPYQGVEDRLVGRKVDQGERPPLDHDECFNSLSCGSQLTDLIGRCWHKDPEARPSAAAVVEELRSIYPVVPWTDLHFAGGQDVDGGGQPHQVLQGWWQNAPVTIEVVDMDDITCSQFLAQIAMLRNLNHANIVGLLAASEQEGKQHAGLVWESAEHDDLHPALPNADAWRALRLDHENVIKLKGVSEHQDGRNWLFFTELAEHRSLGHYIRKHANRLTATDKVKLALGVALGLSYLHSRNPPFACDLRLRRVVVMSDNTPKLTKFTALTPGQEAEMRMKEDVFIFGKLLWELLTERLPYADPRDTLEWWAASERNRPSLDDKRITRLRRGEKLQDLIGQCWRQEASTRPSADDLVKELAAILAPSAAEKLLTAKVVGVLALVTFIMAKLVSGGYITLSSVAQGMVKLCRRR
ncbi:protein kinase domain containing protein [Acanthamoeba castellanii str. Neff]|uniref:Protein kinase domain containing protein n=1 Tax=Acanthamoeba castellanii (strain ATCC 30010 / Neff) TaxID=1257118 RepID=L8GLJ1_ACACF|nr:protein kinase domain containing protein [Acanthamoeba castellanii str. Neff]ELR13699.1 protein kinase domain containing protein [Acanthamoeba castellanii str. Neff]